MDFPPSGTKGLPQLIWRSALTLAIAMAGGFLCLQLKIPIPWIVGAMLVTAAASFTRLPIVNLTVLRSPVRAVIGCMLGTNMDPGVADRVSQWLAPLAGLIVTTILISAVGWIILRRIGRLDPATALFGAVPGGLIEMAVLSDIYGGSSAAIALIHTVRIFTVILSMPVIILAMTGLGELAAPTGVAAATLDPASVLWFLGCAAGGIALGRTLRLPAPDMFGALILSGVAHFMGWTHFILPSQLIASVQVVLGINIGVRFLGLTWQMFASVASVSVLISIAHFLIAGTMAYLVSRLTGIEFVLLVLAYAPAGLGEMSLIAATLGRDAVFVALHHLIRIFGILLISPIVYVRVYKRERS